MTKSATLGLTCWLALTGCGNRDTSQLELRTAGAATVFDTTRDAFSLPLPELAPERRRAFFVGSAFFNENWVIAPASAESHDGLGPLYDARSCSACHFKDGRSAPPPEGQPMSTMLLRVSLPARDPFGAPLPHPVYGDQIQGAAIPSVEREADVFIDYETVSGTFADGERYELRRPSYRIENLGYGPITSDVQRSGRVAPALLGMGLLEAVGDADLEAYADPEDRDGDGISGRTNRVWDASRARHSVGRFGWKAEQPSLLQQVAAAFLGDMGLVTSLFREENCSAAQTACQERPSGGAPEVSDEILNAMVLYVRSLAVPARRDLEDESVQDGQVLFEKSGCASCHRPSFKTGSTPVLPELARIEIHPYTDLLLHDLGPELADQRPVYGASGSEWRTPPLWGLGLLSKVNGHTTLLHDGRARSTTEAILWHGGEAARARRAFVEMSRSERRSLVAFVESR
jgi:CxxC motif-containing protein (DUF1111 family)